MSQINNKHALNRRQFNKMMAGAGTLLGTGMLSSCLPLFSNRSVSSDKTTNTLHFQLPDLPQNSVLTLRSGGKRYTVLPHDAASRQLAKQQQPHLANLADESLTHYAESVSVFIQRPTRFHINYTDPVRGDGLLSVGMHHPKASLDKAQALLADKVADNPHLAALTGDESVRQTHRLRSSQAAVNCTLYNQDDTVLPDFFNSAFESAKAIVRHHPEIMNLDADIAAEVELHLNASAEVANLALSICNQGGAYTHDDNYVDGWCVLVPKLDDNGNQKTDPNGDPIYDFDFSAQTKTDMQPALNEVLRYIKNDPSLEGKQYATRYSDEAMPPLPADAGSSGSNPTRSQRVRSSAATTPSGLDMNPGPGFRNLLWFWDLTKESGNNTFHSWVANISFLSYGVYVEFLDSNGNPVTAKESDLTPAERLLKSVGILPQESNGEYRYRYLGLIGSPDTIFGVPSPSALVPYGFTVEMPANAETARVMVVGPGNGGPSIPNELMVPGIMMTAVLQFMLPMYLIVTGVGEYNTAGKGSLLTKEVMVQFVRIFANVVSAFVDPSENKAMLFAKAMGSFFQAMISAGIDALFEVPEVASYISSTVTEEEAAEAIPFVGWAMKIMALVASAADMAATATEMALLPHCTDYRVRFTQSVEVTIHHDPTNHQFPEVASQYSVILHIGNAQYNSNPVDITLAESEKGNETLTVTLDNVPISRSVEHVEVTFRAANGWTAGHVKTTFQNDPAASGDTLSISATIKEDSVPIKADSTYGHVKKLAYDGSSYSWNVTTTVPSINTPSCEDTTDGLCSLGQLTYLPAAGMLGYSWRAATSTVTDCRTASGGQLYQFRYFAIDDPNGLAQSPGCGFAAPVPLVFDQGGAADGQGNHFYLDPKDTSADNGAYYLRKMVLDGTTAIQTTSTANWGRFPLSMDRLAVHPNRYVVGISTTHSKMAILDLHDTEHTDESHFHNATLMLDEGLVNDGKMFEPKALSIAQNGTILVLEGGDVKRIKAFNPHGAPVKFFTTTAATDTTPAVKSSKISMETETGVTITWLDMAVDKDNLIFILSHIGDGSQSSDYRLDVYGNDGTRIMRNTGIAALRFTVDP
ncbi:MAG: hypothetical protein HQL53_10295, partial [Magnetococcales bacterium]|nr:hypothetical protein [Magnetococcales bacterium]